MFTICAQQILRSDCREIRLHMQSDQSTKGLSDLSLCWAHMEFHRNRCAPVFILFISANKSLNKWNSAYGMSKCPKILYTKVYNQMTFANSADPEQRSSLIRVYTVYHFPTYFKKQQYKKQNLSQTIWNKVFKS